MRARRFLLLIGYLPAAAMASGFSFAPATKYLLGDWQQDTNAWSDTIGVGDVTGDGRDDVVLATTTKQIRLLPSDHSIFVYRQAGNGTLSAPKTYRYDDGLHAAGYEYTTSGLALGDLNNDGILDIVVGYGTGVAAYTADGAGGFRVIKQVLPAVSDQPFNVQLLDVDRDGNLDAIVHGFYGSASVAYGNGTGGFRSVSLMAPAGERLWDVKTGDLNHDGYLDIVELRDGNRVRVIPTSGVSVFGTPIDFSLGTGTGAWSFTYGIAAGDWNGDGRDDIALTDSANFTSDGNGPELVVYRQGTPGALGAPRSYPSVLDVPEGLVSADLDHDGDLDLVTPHSGTNVGVFLNTGAGVFAPEQLFQSPYATWYQPQGQAAGDVNSDGCGDMALASYEYGLVVLRGQGCAALVPPMRTPVHAFDMNADRRSDLMLRQPALNRFVVWRMAGASLAGYVATTLPAGYRMAGAGDFDGDGHDDILWTSNARDLLVSFSDGARYTNQTVPLTYASGWEIIDAADVDGDGKADVLLRNQALGKLVVWFMSGTNRVAYHSDLVDGSYVYAGFGDFDGDGRQDIAWTSAQRDILLSTSHGSWFSTQLQGLNYSLGYELVGTEDINGDGRADLLLRNRSLAKLVVWFMRGSVRETYSALTVGGRNRLVAKGDFDGDGRGDLAWADDDNQLLFSMSIGTTLRNTRSKTPLPSSSTRFDGWQ